MSEGRARAATIHRSLLAVLLVASVALAGCNPSPPPETVDIAASTPTPRDPIMPDQHTLVVGLVDAPSSLDPGDHRERQSETVIRNIYDGLVTRDKRSGVHLELAEEIAWIDDLTLEIKLRRGVLFHDGVEMTADDVVYTFQRIIHENGIEYPEPHTSSRRGLVTPVEAVERIDTYAVRMRLSAPWPPALQMLVHQQIVPKHYVESVGTDGLLAHPVGTGPFKFVSATDSLNEIVLERFDEYYGGAPELPPVGPACVERVVFLVIPDALTRAAALRSGHVDIIQSVPLALIDALSDTEGIQILSAPGTRPTWMDMNLRRPPFDDQRVRRALNYAVDKESLVASVYGGHALALAGPLSPYNEYANNALDPYPSDPVRARELLAQAGWTDSDADDWLDRGGNRLVLTLDTLEMWRPLANALAEELEAIGVRVSVRVWDRSVIRPRLLAGERVAYLDGWGDSAFDPVGHFEAKWHAYVEGAAYGRGNYSGYDNPRVNELISLGEATADPAQRRRIYDEAQQILYEETPAIFLVLPEEIEAAAARVLNWAPASDSRLNLHDVCLAPKGPATP